MSRRIAIIGAGVIGLLSARLLLARGHHVSIIDRQQPGREASWAGGGIVSALYPWRYGPAISALAADATAAHRELANALLRETGIDPEFSECGLLMLDLVEHEQALAWSTQHHRRVEVLNQNAIRALQPGLTDARQGLWFPELGNVRNPRLMQALRVAIEKHPQATCYWNSSVHIDDADCRHILINNKKITFDQIVITAGAWSADLLRPLGIDIPVKPVRGQMLLYPPQPGLLQRIVMRDGRYLIPRRDGRILVGSTLEHTGFDCSITSAAKTLLRDSAARMMPVLEKIEPEMQWAGLRPSSPSGIPWIDVTCNGRLLINTGHFRNGLLLAPAAANLGVALLLGESLSLDPAPYRLDAIRPEEEI